MGRAGRPTGNALPPELRELHEEGLPESWGQYWHGQRSSEQEISIERPDWSEEEKKRLLQHPLLGTLSVITADTPAYDLAQIWTAWVEASNAKHMPLSIDTIQPKWMARVHKALQWGGGVPLLPGTFFAFPNQDTQYIQELSDWLHDNPEEFRKFFRSEILPGIVNDRPGLLQSEIKAEAGDLWRDMLEAEAPELLPALQQTEEGQELSAWNTRIRFVFSWHAFAALREGVSYQEAAMHASRSAMDAVFYDLMRDERLREVLQEKYPACRERLPSNMYDIKDMIFSDDELWYRFSAGDINFEQLLLEALQKHSS